LTDSEKMAGGWCALDCALEEGIFGLGYPSGCFFLFVKEIFPYEDRELHLRSREPDGKAV
jgi:hypothetical protein